jgi:DNA-binding response OmpR family regulator
LEECRADAVESLRAGPLLWGRSESSLRTTHSAFIAIKLVGVRVLVVEDERRLASALRTGLMAEGFAVDLAHNGVDGLHQAREGGYDAIVLDVMLPGLSGYTICERLRQEGNWVPILILSAKDGEYDQADGLDLGADDYLTKPFSYVVLAARLRALLRRGPTPRPSVLSAGDLRLDPARRRVTRGSSRCWSTSSGGRTW